MEKLPKYAQILELKLKNDENGEQLLWKRMEALLPAHWLYTIRIIVQEWSLNII